MTKTESSLFDLSGKVALVTGGGSGLGREFCDALAEFGADIVCCDLQMDRAEETCGIIGKYGHKTLAIQADVADYDQVKAMFQKTQEAFGKLDILVNNAGISAMVAPIHQVEITDWHRVINVNLHGVFYCMLEGIRMMLPEKRGSIINISSIYGIVGGGPVATPYVAAKHAVAGLTRQGAADCGAANIRVNAIAPGYFPATRIGESVGNVTPTEEEIAAYMQLVASKTPMGRTGETSEVKGLMLYLASDASSFTTGQVIPCDGGWTCI